MSDIYWLDTSVLIESKRKYHKRERLPQFWTWLDKQLRAGVVKMPHAVYKELCDGNDWLVDWCKHRQSIGVNVQHDDAIQTAYKQLQIYVGNKYKHVPHQIVEFSGGADGWVVAAARAKGGIVVSEEDKAKKNDTNNIKIPDLAKDFAERKWMHTFDMLDALGADFSKGDDGEA